MSVCQLFSTSVQQEFFYYFPFEKIVFIDFREREREDRGWGERLSFLFHLFIHELTDSCMCPDGGSNPQPQCIGTML